jgi:hypothetical protein
MSDQPTPTPTPAGDNKPADATPATPTTETK